MKPLLSGGGRLLEPHSVDFPRPSALLVPWIHRIYGVTLDS
jgi:hypothetical protein